MSSANLPCTSSHYILSASSSGSSSSGSSSSAAAFLKCKQPCSLCGDAVPGRLRQDEQVTTKHGRDDLSHGLTMLSKPARDSASSLVSGCWLFPCRQETVQDCGPKFLRILGYKRCCGMTGARWGLKTRMRKRSKRWGTRGGRGGGEGDMWRRGRR